LAFFSINILLYFENGTRYGHTYNGRQNELVCDLPHSCFQIFEIVILDIRN